MSKSTGASEILHSSRIDSINELGNSNLDAMSIDEDLDMVEFLKAQAEFDAQRPAAKVDPKRGGPVQPRADIADAEIQAHGLAAEDAYGDATWVHTHKSAVMLNTMARNLYKQGDESRIDLLQEQDGKWGTEGGIRGTWVGNDGVSTGGTTSLKMAQKFVSRFIASKDLFARKFDIAQTYSSASKANLLNSWNALNKMDGARKYAKADKTAMSMKDIATQLGVTKFYDVSTFTERQSPTESFLMVEFTNKETGETQEANLTIEKDGDQRFATAHTGALNRNGLGGAFYQMAVEYAARNRLVIRPDDSLSGVNTYRRTEQMLASAMRSGKSNIMVPHSVQRVYGFQNDAKTQDEHDDNMVRLLLAGLRNARELAPEMGLLNYHPATDTFTLKNGKDATGIVDRMLANEDARAFGLGRSTLARAVLTEMALLGQLDVKSIQSISTPLLYSAREDAELEYKLVEDKYKGTPQWMKAPDGSQTQLTQRQWVQVRTPQFKEWFGDWEKAHATGGVWATKEDVSKVVGSDGEPLVVYHGTDKGGFMAFNQPGSTKRGDLGIFTTSNEGMARSYVRKGRPQDLTPPTDSDVSEWWGDEGGANEETPFAELTTEQANEARDRYQDEVAQYDTKAGIYGVFANIRNPNEAHFEGALWGGERPEQYVVSIDGDLQSRADGKQYFTREEAEEFAKEHPNPLYQDDDGSDYIEPAQDHYQTTDDAVREGLRGGQDGTIIREVVDDGGGPGYNGMPSDVFVANKPEQLKSADWNTGEFGSSDDLRYSKKVGEFVTKLNKDGSLDVTGEPEAIRAKIPGGILGRVTTTGIRFTRLDAPRVASALDGSSNAYSRDGVSDAKHELKAGRYVGAPKKFNTPHKIPTLRKILMSLTLEGERGRFWYERSSEEILRMVGGDVKEARKFVALLAIYSPQAKVDTNSTFALRAWSQYKAGKPISVKTKVMDLKAQEALSDVDKFWSGEKTGNFFNNLLRMIDPSTEGKQGATIDMWMMRAGQYETDAPTKTQYAFMELETNRIATELGWEPQQVQAAIWVAMKARMENAGVKKNTEQVSEKKGWLRYDWKVDEETGKPKKTRVILDEQKHRDNWLAQAFAHDPTTDDTAAAKFDFADGVLRHIGQVSWEPRPSTKLPILPGVHTADYAKQVEFQQAVQRALQDENGGDMIAMRLGLLVDGVTQAPGIWESEVSAGAQVRMAMAPALAGKALYDNQEWASVTVAEAAAIDPGWKKNPRFEMKPALDPSQVKLLDAYAAILGLLLRQDGVGYHRPFYSGNKSQENGVEINIGRALSKEEAQDVWAGVNTEMRAHGAHDWETSDSGSVALISSPNGIRVVNFGAIKDNKVFRKAIQKVANGLPNLTGVLNEFTSVGNLVSNKWSENPYGEVYQSRISGTGSPDLLGWVRDVLAPKIQSVFNDFSARYDWGDPGEIKFSGRDNSHARGVFDSARQQQPGNDRVRDRSVRPAHSDGRQADVAGSHGENGRSAPQLDGRSGASGPGNPVARPGSATKVGSAIHFGKQKGLSTLSGSSHGTGIRGAESEWLQNTTDPRLKKRVYFYLPTTGGIPQPEIGLGGHVYQADLENLYNLASGAIQGSGEKLESAILDAGYSGYINPEQGAIVVLNKDVSVKDIGMVGDHKIIQRRNERIIPRVTTRQEGQELVRQPQGNEMLDFYANRAALADAAPSMRPVYGHMRVKQDEAEAADKVLSDAGSTFRFGEVRYSARERSVQLSWEAKPGLSTGLLPRMGSQMTSREQKEYLDAIRQAMGRQSAQSLLGWGRDRYSESMDGGAWKGLTGWSIQSTLRLPDGKLDARTKHEINFFLAVNGMLTGQEGMAWHLPVFGEKGLGVEFNLGGKKLKDTQFEEVYAAIQQEFKNYSIPPIPSKDGLRFLNYTGLEQGEFTDRIARAIDQTSVGDIWEKASDESSRSKATQREASTHDGLHRPLRPGSPDLQREPGNADIGAFSSEGIRTFSHDGDLIENDWSKGEGQYRELIRNSWLRLKHFPGSKLPQSLKALNEYLDSQQAAIDDVNMLYGEMFDMGKDSLTSRERASGVKESTEYPAKNKAQTERAKGAYFQHPDGTLMTMYHGGGDDIQAVLQRDGISMFATNFAPYANEFARLSEEYGSDNAQAVVYPVNILVNKPFDWRIQGHRDQVQMEKYPKGFSASSFDAALLKGKFELLESKEFANAAKKAGFDSVLVRDDKNFTGFVNVGVFDASDVVFAMNPQYSKRMKEDGDIHRRVDVLRRLLACVQ
jgi:hypothetical protein